MNKLIKVMVPVLALTVGSMQLAQADTTSGVTISGLTSQVISALSNMYAGLYNQALDDYKALAYEFDTQIPITVVNNNAQNTANTAVDKATQEQSAQTVKDSFAGIRAKTQEQLTLLEQPGEDDVIEGAASKSFFTGTSDAFKAENEKAKAGNAAFNIESLLGPNTYTNQKAMDDAQAFLTQLNSLAPSPTVIRLAPKFDVPIADPDDPSKDVATIGGKKALSADELKKMRDTLQEDKAYREYKRSYRGVIAARSIYLNNLLHSYQERVPQVGDKSALQIRDDKINGRLTQEYYDKMSKASPATVSRESLFVLAEISSQLNALREQQNLMIEMNSISGLNQLYLTSKMLDMQAKDIGKKIYCMDPEHEKEKICTTDLGKMDVGEITTGQATGQTED